MQLTNTSWKKIGVIVSAIGVVATISTFAFNRISYSERQHEKVDQNEQKLNEHLEWSEKRNEKLIQQGEDIASMKESVKNIEKGVEEIKRMLELRRR